MLTNCKGVSGIYLGNIYVCIHTQNVKYYTHIFVIVYCYLYIKQCWVVLTQIWVKYGQTQMLG